MGVHVRPALYGSYAHGIRSQICAQQQHIVYVSVRRMRADTDIHQFFLVGVRTSGPKRTCLLRQCFPRR